MNKTKMYVSLLLASVLMVAAGCDQKKEEETSETTVSLEVLDTEQTKASRTTKATTEAPVEEYTEVVTTTPAETTEVVTTTTAAPLKSSIDKNYLNEEYIETFSIRPDMKEKVLDVTLNINGTPNVSVKSTTYVKNEVFATSEVAISDNGDKVYNTIMWFFPVKFLVQADNTTYILNDDESFYMLVTPESGIDTSTLSQSDIKYNYTITSNTADYVTLDDTLYIRMQARDNSSGLDLILYFDENGVLTYIYTINAVFGEALTKLEYTTVEPEYFSIPKSYKEYTIEQYNEYLERIKKDLGFNPIVTTTTVEEPEPEPEITEEE